MFGVWVSLSSVTQLLTVLQVGLFFFVVVKTELFPKRYCRGLRSQDAVKEEGDYT